MPSATHTEALVLCGLSGSGVACSLTRLQGYISTKGSLCRDWKLQWLNNPARGISLFLLFLSLPEATNFWGLTSYKPTHCLSLVSATVICSGKLWYRPFNKDLDLMVLVAPFQYIIILWFCGFGVPKMSEENGPWRVLEARISLCLCSASLELTGLSSHQERAASSLPALPEGAYLRAAPMQVPALAMESFRKACWIRALASNRRAY